MKSEAMFSSLLKYQKEDYYVKHPVIEFDTLYEQNRYEIIAVIRSKVFKKTDQTFKFYQFVQADSREAFEEYVDNMKRISLYDTGADVTYGDQLLTLVTCSYHTDNGRLAVLARKLDD
jgi:sortase B